MTPPPVAYARNPSWASHALRFTTPCSGPAPWSETIIRFASGPAQLGEPPDRLVEDAVDLGDGALQALGLPVRPADVVDVVGRHEDDEEELGVEPLGQPLDDLELLRGGTAHEVEVELAVLKREPVVELERPVPAPQLVADRRGEDEALLARGGVEAGDREPVHLRRRPREGDVDDPEAATRAPQAIPNRRRPPEAPVYEPELVPGLVALGEVPDPVPAGIHAGDDRRPGMRGERVRGRPQHASGAFAAGASDVRKLPCGQHRIDDVEGRRVEADDGQDWTGHPARHPLQVRNQRTEWTPMGMRQRESCRGEASQAVSVKTCPNCGQSTRDDDRFCPSCGQPTDPRRQSPPSSPRSAPRAGRRRSPPPRRTSRATPAR